MKKLMILAAVALMAAASQAAVFKWSASGVQNAAGTGLYSGTATLYAYLSTAEASTAIQVDQASMVNGTISAKTFEDTEHFTASKQYVFYYTMNDGKNDFTSGTLTRQAQATKAAVPVAFNATGGWSGEPEPTPEPTSAMLMLLGVAGLALKRKRA